jgi:hypothetical protein
MKRLLAVVVLATLLVGLAPVAAHAHGHGVVGAALALGAFAVLSPFLVLSALAQPFYVPPPPVYPAPAAYASAPAYPVGAYVVASRPSAARLPAVRREVVYAHGRHVLLGDGVTSAYQWVWVPNPPAGAPPPPPR